MKNATTNEKNFFESLKGTVEFHPRARAIFGRSSMVIFIEDEDGKKEFASDLEIQFPTERFGETDKGRMAIGGAGSFNPEDNQVAYWRILHAAEIAKNFDKVIEAGMEAAAAQYK